MIYNTKNGTERQPQAGALVYAATDGLSQFVAVAKDNERLDTIVFKHYGHLRFFEQVLAINPKLKPILKAGDTVILPEFKEVKSKEQAKLW
ncbi:tail protein X [Campylobacter curvus]|uniref:tail protein X n=1 Tax=Campylobacter curvus TaxID=200 RepID=UPI00201642CA|nr:tail protein X [Campylobacter curvus]